MSARFVMGENGELYVLPMLNVNDLLGDVTEKVQEEAYKDGYNAGEADGLVAGHAQGYADAQLACGLKHYTGTFTGTGSSSIDIEGIPFDPDLFIVSCFPEDAISRALSGAMLFIYDKRVPGGDTPAYQYATLCAILDAGSVYSSSGSVSGATSVFIRDETGKITLQNLKTIKVLPKDATSLGYEYINGIFIDGETYTVTAVKF